MSTIASRAAARLLVVPLIASACLLAPAPQAVADGGGSSLTPAAELAKDETASHPQVSSGKDKQTKAEKRVARVMSTVRSRAGKPYVYGAAGPNAFDCSGLVQWTYRRAGKSLPRTSSAQAGATQRVRSPRIGDLVFFTSGGRVYHVGIYAGNRMLWHASRPGVPVRKDRIWSSSVFYGRVR